MPERKIMQERNYGQNLDISKDLTNSNMYSSKGSAERVLQAKERFQSRRREFF
jgi:hypothetical protein